MSRLSVLCFAGTYGLALVCDLARFFVRASARWYLTVFFLALGWIVHTAYLVNLLVQDQPPHLASQVDFLVTLAWIFAAITLYLMCRVPRTVAIGLFVLPITVGLSALAWLASLRPQTSAWASWTPVWGSIHGGFLTLGAVFTSLAFVAGWMYLAQARRLKQKMPHDRASRLPSLEQSERLNRLAITMAFPFLTFGLLIGVALNFESGAATRAGALRWSDPKILSAGATWLLFAALLHARFRPEMRGRRVMILSIVAFAFLIFTMVGVNLLLPTAHGTPFNVGGQP